MNIVLLLAALNWVFFGLGALFGPQYVIPNSLDNELALVFVRHMGAAAVVIGLLAWFTRAATDKNVRRQNLLLLFLAASMAAVNSGLAVSAGTMPSSDWVFVGVDVFFALAFGYFRFLKPE